MSNYILKPPYQPFTLPTHFKGIFNAEIYVGVVDSTDPKNNQLQAYAEGEDGSLTEIPQPLTTNGGGFVVYNGQPAKIVIKSAFSLIVYDKVGRQVWYEPNMSKVDPETALTQIRNDMSSQLGFVYAADWYSGILIPNGAMTGKLAYWHDGQFYSVGTDTGFTSTDFDSDLSAGRFKAVSVSSKNYNQGYQNPLDPFWGGREGDFDNGPIIQSILNTTGMLMSHGKFKIKTPVTVPAGSRINLLNVGEIYSDDGFLTSGNGKSLLTLDLAATNIIFEGITLNANSGALDFSKWPNTETAGTESNYGLTSPVKLVSHQGNKGVKYKSCSFLNCVGGAIKEFGTFGGGNAGDAEFIDCYFDLVRGNCIDGEFENISVINPRVNLIGDIRAATRGGLVVATCDNSMITGVRARQTTDSTIYLNGTGHGRHVVTSINILYSGKDAVKVLNGTKDSVFGDINVVAAGKTPVGFFGGTVATGVLGTIRIGYEKGQPPTDILDQTDVTWSTPKVITACNLQEPKWNQGSGNGGAAFVVADSNVAFSTLAIGSYTGPAVLLSSTDISAGVLNVNFGDGPAVYATTSNLNLDNLSLSETNQNQDLSPSSLISAIEILGLGNVNITSVNYDQLGGGLIKTGSDTSKLNIDNIAGNDFNTKSYADCHLIYANGAASPLSVTDINISNVAATGSGTSGRLLWARSCKSVNISQWTGYGGIEGIRLSDCEIVNLSNVIHRNSAGDGVGVSGCDSVTLMAVQGHYNGGTGVKTYSDCTNVIAVGCQGKGNTVAQGSIGGDNVKPANIADFNNL